MCELCGNKSLQLQLMLFHQRGSGVADRRNFPVSFLFEKNLPFRTCLMVVIAKRITFCSVFAALFFKTKSFLHCTPLCLY